MSNSTTQPDDFPAKFDELSDLLDKQPKERPTEDRTDPNPQNTLETKLAPDHFLCAKSPEELLELAKSHRVNATEFFKKNNLQKAADQYELAIKKLIIAKMHDDYVWKAKSGPVVDDLTMSDYEQNRITSLPTLLSELTPEQSSTLTEIYRLVFSKIIGRGKVKAHSKKRIFSKKKIAVPSFFQMPHR